MKTLVHEPAQGHQDNSRFCGGPFKDWPVAIMVHISLAALALIGAGCTRQHEDTAWPTQPESYMVSSNGVSLTITNDGGRLTVALQNLRTTPVLIRTEKGSGDPELSMRLYHKTGEFCHYTQRGLQTMSVEVLLETRHWRPQPIPPNGTKAWTYDLRDGFQSGPLAELYAGNYLLEVTAHEIIPAEKNQISFAIDLGRVAISIKQP